MKSCDYCNREIEQGYLGYDFYIICEDCVKVIYSKDELDKKYEQNEIFWTTFYDD